MDRRLIRRGVVYLCLITLPFLLFINIWQAYRYRAVADEVESLESLQKDWLETNKRMIAGMARLDSPGRIDQIARDNIGLVTVDTGQIMRIKFVSAEDGNE